ncbi:MAG: RodZ domain-containing protein [Acidimicrobiales bacterium]
MAPRGGDDWAESRRDRRQRGPSGGAAAPAPGSLTMAAPPSIATWAGDPSATGAMGVLTRTMQVPMVRSQDPFATTGQVPAVVYDDRPMPAPSWLQAAVWLVALLVLLGAAGLVVHQVRPAWLKSLESRAAATSTAATQATAASSTARVHRTSSGGITETTTGPQAETVAVRAAKYTVVVTTSAPCWVQVSSPTSAAAVFAQVMQAGATQSFDSAGSKLTVQLGSSAATVTVKVGGKPAKWQFKPTAAPYVLNFTSST